MKLHLLLSFVLGFLTCLFAFVSTLYWLLWLIIPKASIVIACGLFVLFMTSIILEKD